MKLFASFTKSSIPYRKLLLELLVVFLGVTAGFIMNNYKAGQKEKELEIHYLKGFLSDVNSNITSYQEYLDQDSAWLDAMRPMVLQMQADSFPADSATVLLDMVTEIGKASVYNATYQDVSNSGSLSLIQNLALRRALADYQLRIADGTFLDEYFYRFFNSYVTPIVMRDYDILGNHFIPVEIMDDPHFTNVILGYLSMIQQRRQVYGDLVIDSKTLKSQIEEELLALD